MGKFYIYNYIYIYIIIYIYIYIYIHIYIYLGYAFPTKKQVTSLSARDSPKALANGIWAVDVSSGSSLESSAMDVRQLALGTKINPRSQNPE
jgi:hypothetical protein